MDGFLEVSWACLAGSGALRRAQRPLRGWKKIADSHVDSYFCFQTRFFAILERFGTDFGRFWEAKMDAKIDFWEVFAKTSTFRKSLFFLRKIAIFKVSGYKIHENSMKNRVRKSSENIFVLNVDFFLFLWGFGHHLGFSFSFKNRPKI